jgi:putative membrane protein
MTPLQALGLILFAANDGEPTAATHSVEFFPPTFWPGLCATLVYGVVGIALVVLGFKVFDWLTPRIHIQQEIAEKNNMAVAILMASVILGICYIVAQVSR